jgi:hypothetical protein
VRLSLVSSITIHVLRLMETILSSMDTVGRLFGAAECSRGSVSSIFYRSTEEEMSDNALLEGNVRALPLRRRGCEPRRWRCGCSRCHVSWPNIGRMEAKALQHTGEVVSSRRAEVPWKRWVYQVAAFPHGRSGVSLVLQSPFRQREFLRRSCATGIATWPAYR